jgi:hypothetical protein
VALDLPGVQVDSIDLGVERNVLTVRAERKDPAGEGTERRFPDAADPCCRGGQAAEDRNRDHSGTATADQCLTDREEILAHAKAAFRGGWQLRSPRRRAAHKQPQRADHLSRIVVPCRVGGRGPRHPMSAGEPEAIRKPLEAMLSGDFPAPEHRIEES